MMQERLNNVMLLHCHKNKTDSLDMSEIIKDFVSANDARKNDQYEYILKIFSLATPITALENVLLKHK